MYNSLHCMKFNLLCTYIKYYCFTEICVLLRFSHLKCIVLYRYLHMYVYGLYVNLPKRLLVYKHHKSTI